MATRETISQSDYFKLIGLFTVAAECRRMFAMTERAAAGITGESDDGSSYYGCTSDSIGDPSGDARADVDKLLAKLNMEPVK